MDDKAEIIELTVDIVSAYASNNEMPASDLSAIIKEVHQILQSLADGKGAEAPPEPQTPAVSIKKSVTPDYLISLEDGRRYKSLKRHLRTKYDMTPEQYRAKWKLPRDYPMVAPNYSASRSALAKAAGLGQGGRNGVRAAAETAKRGRPRKVTVDA